ncbi:uncharacterized protein B0T15DRAFT_515874 [Chaetomium strumarium]|uniref:DUF7707 domain-containing protein n=1 Tax=Chaetomium strumarium TaxID=1170767 RepID=A0AAJ0H137_9PEZI|nr:hypothetical protein B0T15DRAFT_515874 [Chaetomium strumarium]
MVSFRLTLLALTSAVAVSADYYIDPESVPMSSRKAWCNDQRSSCPTICLQTSTGQPEVNTCDPETLTYGCVCSDGKQPNISQYTLTLPYYVCTEWGNQCVKDCGSNNGCASDCREKHPCGAQNPPRANTTATSTTATSSATGTPTNQVFDGAADGSNIGNNNAAGALRFGSSYGLAVVAGSLFAGFAMLL